MLPKTRLRINTFRTQRKWLRGSAALMTSEKLFKEPAFVAALQSRKARPGSVLQTADGLAIFTGNVT